MHWNMMKRNGSKDTENVPAASFRHPLSWLSLTMSLKTQFSHQRLDFSLPVWKMDHHVTLIQSWTQIATFGDGWPLKCSSTALALPTNPRLISLSRMRMLKMLLKFFLQQQKRCHSQTKLCETIASWRREVRTSLDLKEWKGAIVAFQVKGSCLAMYMFLNQTRILFICLQNVIRIMFAPHHMYLGHTADTLTQSWDFFSETQRQICRHWYLKTNPKEKSPKNLSFLLEFLLILTKQT